MSEVSGIIVARADMLRGSVRLKVFTQSEGPVVGCVRRDKSTGFMEGSYVVGQCVRNGALPLWEIEQNDDPFFLLIHEDRNRLLVWKTALELCGLLCERESAIETYTALLRVKCGMRESNDLWMKEYLQFELSFLYNLGYGLSLTQCAVTKQKKGLAYISPNTGCAVTEPVGRPYANKLLPYAKAFHVLAEDGGVVSAEDFLEALSVLSFFIKKCVKKAPIRSDLDKLLYG